MAVGVVELVRTTIEVSAFVGILLMGFLLSWKYLRARCFVPLHIHSFSQKLTFSLTLVVTCFGLFTLLFTDITGIISATSRAMLWRATLGFVVLLLVVAYPVAQVYHYYTKNNASTAAWPRSRQIPLTAGTWAVLVLLFWWSLSPKKALFQGVSSNNNNGNGNGYSTSSGIWSYPGWVKRIGVIGVVLTAALSGYGSVMYIYGMLCPEAKRGRKEELLGRFREQLSDNERFISEKYDKLRRLKNTEGYSSSTSSGSNYYYGSVNTSSGGFINKLRNTTDYEETLLDIEALESFGRRLRDEIARIQRAQEEERLGRMHMSMCDRAEKWASWGVALYCAYYLITGLYVFFFLGCAARAGPDPITVSINLFLSLFHVSIDTRFWSQIGSAVFSGAMVLSSLSEFFTRSSTIAKSYHIHDDYYDDGSEGYSGFGNNSSSSSSGFNSGESAFLLPTKSNTSNIGSNSSSSKSNSSARSFISKKSWTRLRPHIVVGMCQAMGTYFLSTLILTAGSLPLSSRETLSASLGGLDVKFYQEWFNALFGVSIIGTLLTILVKKKTSK